MSILPEPEPGLWPRPVLLLLLLLHGVALLPLGIGTLLVHHLDGALHLHPLMVALEVTELKRGDAGNSKGANGPIDAAHDGAFCA